MNVPPFSSVDCCRQGDCRWVVKAFREQWLKSLSPRQSLRLGVQMHWILLLFLYLGLSPCSLHFQAVRLFRVYNFNISNLSYNNFIIHSWSAIDPPFAFITSKRSFFSHLFKRSLHSLRFPTGISLSTLDKTAREVYVHFLSFLVFILF